MSAVYRYTVVSSQLSSSDTLAVVLRCRPKQGMSYKPGQYAAVSFIHNGGPTASRCLTMASSPTEAEYLEFVIRPGGKSFNKNTIANIAPGTEALVEGPYGDATFDPKRDKSALFLAEEGGVAPAVSMLRYAARQQLESDIMVLYAFPTQERAPLLAELIELAQVNRRMHLLFVVSSGPTDGLRGLPVTQGTITSRLIDQVTAGSYGARTYFVSGSTGFVHTMTKMLLASGAPIESIVAASTSQDQETPRKIHHNIALQTYSLTGLSLILGTATALGGGGSPTIAATTPNLSGKAGGQQSFPNTTNSRQSAVDQTIAQLQSGGTTDSSSSTSSPIAGTAPSGGNASSSPVTSTGSSGTAGGSAKTGTATKTPTASSQSSTSSGSTGSSGAATKPPATTPTPTPTPTPAPAPPPPPPAVAPTTSFYASTTSITSGQSVTLSWSVNSNATSPVTCTASGGWSGSKGTSGSTSVKPGSTTTYTLKCSNSAGSSTKSVTINVAPACVSTASNPC